jgi:hypothetical protein
LSEFALENYEKTLDEMDWDEKYKLVADFMWTFYYTLDDRVSEIYGEAGISDEYFEQMVAGIDYEFEWKKYNVRVGDCDQGNALAVRLFNALWFPARNLSGYMKAEQIGWVGHGWMEIWDGKKWVQKDFTPSPSVKIPDELFVKWWNFVKKDSEHVLNEKTEFVSRKVKKNRKKPRWRWRKNKNR